MSSARFLASTAIIAGCLAASLTAAQINTPTPTQTPTATLVAAATGPPFFPSGPTQPQSEMIEFAQVANGTTKGQVLGGEEFDPTRLPATFRATFSDGSVCTATLIGPRVLLTAAHCLDQKFKNEKGVWQTIDGGIRVAGRAFVYRFATCQMAPAYTAVEPPVERRPRNSKDFALCQMGDRVPVRAETIDLRPEAIASKQSAFMAGFGCTDAQLNAGIIPEGAEASKTLVAAFNKFTGETVQGWETIAGHVGKKEGIICPGDSGGATYAGVDLTAGHDKGWRGVAVSSAVGPSPAQLARWNANPPTPAPDGVEYISYLAPLSDPDFKSFLTTFMAGRPQDRKVCGLSPSLSATDCRG